MIMIRKPLRPMGCAIRWDRYINQRRSFDVRQFRQASHSYTLKREC